MQVLSILRKIVSIILIIIIFLKVPDNDGISQYMGFSENIVGNPKLKNENLENVIWGCVILFILLSISEATLRQ
tara:strand:+ start:5798 stop:6019 length:222 start_codon:yes stop_codon:yes gene_type:complete